jgi:hypothetical protein
MGVNSSKGFNFRLMASGSNGGYTQLDTFADEPITISDNITGLFDIGVLPSDFTRQIMLPGTKVNNLFFEHVYDISVQNPYLFATNVKVPAYFDFDGIYLSQGYLQLNKVNVKANKYIESYEVSIFGGLSSFARDLNRYFLTDLTNLSTYNHISSFTNISASWDRTFFNGDIVYPFIDYGSGWQYTSGQYQVFGLDDFNGGITVQDYKPAIRVKKVLDKIFEFTGYTYTSSFMNQPWLDDVYMVCNNSLKYPEYVGVDLETYGVIKVGAISGSGMTNVVLPSGSFVTLPWINKLTDPQQFYNNNAYRVDTHTNLSGVLNLNINVSCSANNMPGTLSANGTWQIRMIETGSSTVYSTRAIQSYIFFFDQLQQSRTGGINQTFELPTEFLMEDIPAGNYYFQVRQSPNFPSSVASLPVVTMDPDNTTKSFLEIKKVKQAADFRLMQLQLNMPYGENGIKLIDFIQGLQKKFNLVIYPNKRKSREFIIEDFNSWYGRGETKDFNRYINLNDNIEVTPANNLAVNKLQFGDKLGNDYIALQFQKGTTREFGKTYYTDTQNFFSQGEFNVETSFSTTPLVRVAGTGLSGSVGGINPPPSSERYVGGCKYGYSFDPQDTCTSPAVIQTYTTSGNLQTGLIVYADQYGNSPILNLRYVTGPSGGIIYELNTATGMIGSQTGYYC